MQNMSLRTNGGLTMQSYCEVCSKGPVIWDWVSINSAAEVCENKVCRAQKNFVRKKLFNHIPSNFLLSLIATEHVL